MASQRHSTKCSKRRLVQSCAQIVATANSIPLITKPSAINSLVQNVCFPACFPGIINIQYQSDSMYALLIMGRKHCCSVYYCQIHGGLVLFALRVWTYLVATKRANKTSKVNHFAIALCYNDSHYQRAHSLLRLYTV